MKNVYSSDSLSLSLSHKAGFLFHLNFVIILGEARVTRLLTSILPMLVCIHEFNVTNAGNKNWNYKTVWLFSQFFSFPHFEMRSISIIHPFPHWLTHSIPLPSGCHVIAIRKQSPLLLTPTSILTSPPSSPSTLHPSLFPLNPSSLPLPPQPPEMKDKGEKGHSNFTGLPLMTFLFTPQLLIPLNPPPFLNAFTLPPSTC